MTTNLRENLGPAERIIQSLLTYTDHCYHNRPGIVTPDARFAVGVRWEPVTHRIENDVRVVYRLTKTGKKTTEVRVGAMDDARRICSDAGTLVGEYRPAGLFSEVVTWFYRQIADIWQLDNEFVARWASYAFQQKHRDLKVILAAFSLVQSRKGDPIRDGGKVVFFDEDFRDIGEAMMLAYKKGGDTDLDPKELLRIHDVLTLPSVAAINRELGFGGSARKSFLGRWPRAVAKYLRHREDNPKILDSQIKAGFRSQLIQLAQRVGYRPQTPIFFQKLRWKQQQADDGRRTIAIGATVLAAETWEGLSEPEICLRIAKQRPNWKRIAGLLPATIGVTRAIMAASIAYGGLSDRDLVILTPTLEELGLLTIADIRARWEKATQTATDMRASNIARNVRNQELKEQLQKASDAALQREVKEVVNNIRIYFIVDISGSMEGSIEAAKTQIAQFLQGFPSDRLHVSVFNTSGRVIEIRHSSAAGVRNAFQGIKAAGGTDYGAGVRALQDFKPKADEDVIFIFVGDEEASTFTTAVRASGLNPLSFGLLKTAPVGQTLGRQTHNAVRRTAAELGIPCFLIDERTFADPYAIPRTMKNLIAATPVGVTPATVTAKPRLTLVDQILQTELLKKPVWAD